MRCVCFWMVFGEWNSIARDGNTMEKQQNVTQSTATHLRLSKQNDGKPRANGKKYVQPFNYIETLRRSLMECEMKRLLVTKIGYISIFFAHLRHYANIITMHYSLHRSFVNVLIQTALSKTKNPFKWLNDIRECLFNDFQVHILSFADKREYGKQCEVSGRPILFIAIQPISTRWPCSRFLAKNFCFITSEKWFRIYLI